MQCPNCKTEIGSAAAFCSNCGTKLTLACPICAAEVQAGAKFCAQCGAQCGAQIPPQVDPVSPSVQKSDLPQPPSPLPIQSEGYERRMVTILFADIAGYSTLSETLDPENLLDIMSRAYPCLLEPIKNHDGMVVQVMGDGILAYFGTPIAKEDDPERAIMAGLEITNRIQTYAQQLRQDQGLEKFNVRVGINTGLVVVGDLNANRLLEYIALGDAVNLAARLQQIAPPNGVLISHETYRQIQGVFDVIPQSPITVKGRQQITQTYLVKQIRPFQRRSRLRGIHGVETPMLGREPEMAALHNHYQDAIIGGETALVLVHGEAGIGKTRLTKTFVDGIAQEPIAPVIIQGRAIPSTQPVPFGILRNLFARTFNILETDSSTEALQKFRKGAQTLIHQDQADLVGQLIGFDFKSSLAVQRLFGTPDFGLTANLYLINFFRRLAQESLLILIEDLHWIDDSSLDLITDLVEKLSQEPGTRLMIICTARPEFFERRENWSEGLQGFTTLQLRRLSRLRSRALIAEILHSVEDIPEDLFTCVTDVAEGNPFFIEELIKMLIEKGIIDTKQDSWQVNLEKLVDIQVPPTLTGILQARMDSLPAAEKLMLQRAAVIGRTFWDGLLRALTDNETHAQHIKEHLSNLRERGLIFSHERSSIQGHQEYLFKHALVRDAAYETVLLKHRRIYHSQVAAWIEANAGERLEEHLALIASHYVAGGQQDLAVEWTLRAGERAAKQYSMQEARNLFEQALKKIQSDDLEHLWRATIGHSEAMGILGDIEERHADDQKLLELAQKMKDPSRIAEAHYLIGSQAYREGHISTAHQALEQALTSAQAADDLTRQAEILPMLVAILTAEGDLEAAGTWAELSLNLANQCGDAGILARALTNLSLYYQSIGDVTSSVDFMCQLIEISQQQGNRLGEILGLTNLGYFYLPLGQFEDGYKFLQQAHHAAKRLQDRRTESYILLNLGLAEWRLGQPDTAIQTINQSISSLEAIGDRSGLASGLFYLGLAHETAGNVSEAITHFERSRETFESLGANFQMIEPLAGLVRLALTRNDLVKANQITLQICDFIEEEGSQGFELPSLVYLTCARVFQACGDSERLDHTLARGRSDLSKRLKAINDENWQALFLESIPEHRALMTFDQMIDNDLKSDVLKRRCD